LRVFEFYDFFGQAERKREKGSRKLGREWGGGSFRNGIQRERADVEERLLAFTASIGGRRLAHKRKGETK
jgi:hypothetical protein